MKSWELSKKAKDKFNIDHLSIIKSQKYNDLYNKSIILIGPSGAGKSTVAEELKKKTHMPRLCLDIIANNQRREGLNRKYANNDEFYYSLVYNLIETAKNRNDYGIVDFGAGHSVYDDKKIFKRIKQLLKPFKNVILLLPLQDEEKSLEIMAKRSTGDTQENRKFIESPCNKELAKYVVYGNGRTPEEIADEIIERIENKTNVR